MLLIDTGVLVDYLRNHQKASTFLEETHESLGISSITAAELYAGIKGKKEQEILSQFLTVFHIFAIDAEIAKLGGLLRNEFSKSHGTGLADAFIAATVMHHHATLVTLNVKHFPMIKNVFVPYKK